MSSLDETSRTTLRSWWTEGNILEVAVSLHDGVSFFGRGKLSEFDDDGLTVGWSLPVSGDLWTLAVLFKDAELSSTSVTSGLSVKLMVTVKVGALTITLAGPDPSLKPAGRG